MCRRAKFASHGAGGYGYVELGSFSERLLTRHRNYINTPVTQRYEQVLSIFFSALSSLELVESCYKQQSGFSDHFWVQGMAPLPDGN